MTQTPFSETDRPAADEIAKRVAEAGGGLTALAKAMAVENYRANQQAHRRRLADDHKLGMKLNGLDLGEQTKAEDDLVGDVIVTGDLYGDAAVKALGKGNAESPQATAPTSSLVSKAAPYVLAGVLGAAGVGTPWLYSAVTDKPQPASGVDADTQYILELVPNETE